MLYAYLGRITLNYTDLRSFLIELPATVMDRIIIYFPFPRFPFFLFTRVAFITAFHPALTIDYRNIAKKVGDLIFLPARAIVISPDALKTLPVQSFTRRRQTAGIYHAA